MNSSTTMKSGSTLARSTCCAMLLLTLALTGCGSSGGSGSPTSDSSSRVVASSGVVASSSAVGSGLTGGTASHTGVVKIDAATKKAISHAFVVFFSSKTTVADSTRVLQHGAVFKSMLAAQAKKPAVPNLTAAVSAVVLQSTKVANVTFSLLSSGKVLLPDTPGTAVKEDGTWKVGAETFCALLKLQSAAPKACDDTSITALPS